MEPVTGRIRCDLRNGTSTAGVFGGDQAAYLCIEIGRQTEMTAEIGGTWCLHIFAEIGNLRVRHQIDAHKGTVQLLSSFFGKDAESRENWRPHSIDLR